MRGRWLLAVVGGCVLIAPAGAQLENLPPEDPAHQELRALKEEMVKAFNDRDIKRLLEFLHPDVVVTWQNGEVSRKHDGVRAYYQRMLLDKNAVVETLTIDQLDVKELSILYGRDKDKDTTVAYGTMEDSYKLRDGMAFNLHSRWSVTAVKQGGRWVIANGHLSANVFENQVLYQAIKRTAFWTGGLALAGGLVAGAGGTLLLKRRKPAA